MPFYIRKSVSAGPFRFNLSKSGVGMSVGVTGFRVGTGPRGHYVHAGRGGLYYRASLGKKKNSSGRAAERVETVAPFQNPVAQNPDVEMIRVSSGDVLEMADARFLDLLKDLNSKQQQLQLSFALGTVAALIGLVLMFNYGLTGFLAGVVLTLLGFAGGTYLDGFLRSAVVMYDLEADAEAAYTALLAAFDNMAKASGIWRIDSGGQVRDLTTWKRNAGASHLVDRKPTTFSYSLPAVLKCNITPPAMLVGKEMLFFLPDVVLVLEGTRFGAVGYDQLRIRWEPRRYIESETVPSDAQVVGHTWAYPNKDGGPDRRFANNTQIPVCLYESLHISSANGLNELLQLSVVDRVEPFAQAAQRLAGTIGSSTALALPQLKTETAAS